MRPQFPHLQNGDVNGPYLTGVALSQARPVRSSAQCPAQRKHALALESSGSRAWDSLPPLFWVDFLSAASSSSVGGGSDRSWDSGVSGVAGSLEIISRVQLSHGKMERQGQRERNARGLVRTMVEPMPARI